ncbi:TPA: hypothetical protein DCZ39_01650 [Patescibacteria group bacterium]|nr:hypothetical protein [Candidatus Gracilibacteria bacterium]
MITALESSTFPSALVTLNLSYNEISSIKAGDFAGLSTLNILSLAHNKIGSIVISAFSSPTALRNLNLSYNQIPAIPGQAISVGHDITTLNLSYNCNIDGVQPIYYDNGGYGNFTTDIDDLNCANINSATPA